MCQPAIVFLTNCIRINAQRAREWAMVLQVSAFVFEPAAAGSPAKLTSLTTAPADGVFGAYDVIASVDVAGVPHLLVYERASGAARFYAASLTSPFFTLAGNANLNAAWDAIESFVLANKSYLMCYQ